MIPPASLALRSSASRRAIVAAIVSFGWIGAVTSCGDSAPTTGGAVCTYAQTIHCTGPGGCDGVSTCKADLSAYGECACATEAGAAGQPDAGEIRDASGARDGS